MSNAPIPNESGWYLVTLHQFNKEQPAKHSAYIKDWIEFDGVNWDYFGYTGRFIVTAIHKKEA